MAGYSMLIYRFNPDGFVHTDDHCNLQLWSEATTLSLTPGCGSTNGCISGRQAIYCVKLTASKLLYMNYTSVSESTSTTLTLRSLLTYLYLFSSSSIWNLHTMCETLKWAFFWPCVGTDLSLEHRSNCGRMPFRTSPITLIGFKPMTHSPLVPSATHWTTVAPSVLNQ